MFDRFIRLARARRALKEERFLDALREASDPQIAEDRRAEDVRRRAGAALVGKAERRLEAGDVSLAMAEVRQLRRLADGEAVDAVARDVERARSARDAQAAARQQLGAEFRELVSAGRLADERPPSRSGLVPRARRLPPGLHHCLLFRRTSQRTPAERDLGSVR